MCWRLLFKNVLCRWYNKCASGLRLILLYSRPHSCRMVLILIGSFLALSDVMAAVSRSTVARFCAVVCASARLAVAWSTFVAWMYADCVA